MLFNSYEFAVFFALLLVADRLVPVRSRLGLLLGASLLFYFLWIPKFLLLLLADIGVNYALLQGILRSRRPRLFLTISVTFTLTVLAYYKYLAFLAGALLPIIEGIPIDTDVALPLGISFFSFQIVALAVDAYRGGAVVPQSLREYTLYICFFPQLIAGPILRSQELLPQLRAGDGRTGARSWRGFRLLGVGLAKKVLLADLLLAPGVEAAFQYPGLSSGITSLIGAYSFAFQIYFDFSGYTDMARGIALLLGYELPMNFQEPYLARDPSEFWRKWHRTLSNWLRDYVYVPLGGNRVRVSRIYANLILTMLVGGLWHGAGWHFILWGGLHGVLLAAHRLVSSGRLDPDRPLAWADVPKILLTFHAVAFLLVVFRANTVSEAWLILRQVVVGAYDVSWPVGAIGIVGLCAALHLLERWVRTGLPEWERTRSGWSRGAEAVAVGVVAALSIVLGGAAGEFIYFQF